MKAINNYLVVDKITDEPIKVAGLIITESNDDETRYNRAKVISVGNLVEGVSEGDIIQYDKHSGFGISVKNTLLLCNIYKRRCYYRMKLTSQDLRDINLFKYYRLTRKWACKTYNILDADLELLFYLDCEGRFTRKDFIDGVYTFSWDKARWDRLRQDGWIDTWRHRNRTTIKYSVYKTSYRCKQLINRIYRILLGEEDLPTSERSIFYNNKSYTDKVFNKAIDDMIKDKDR